MNWILINDYLKRWFALMIVIGYGGISIVYAKYEVTDLFPMLSSLALGLYCFYFWMDIHLHSTVRFIRSLPVQRDEHARTVWFEGVLTPVLVALAIYGFGAVTAMILFPAAGNLFTYFPKCLIGWLFFASGFFIAFSIYHGRERGWFGTVVFTLTVVISCILFVTSLMSWNLPAVKEIFTGASVMLAYISYHCASRFINLHPSISTSADSISAQQDYCQQDMSIGLYERIQANPFLSTTLNSFFLIVIAGLLVASEQYVYKSQGALVSVFLILCAAVLIFAFYILGWISFLSSMRLFISLPVSRKKLTILLIVLPGIILLPIALLPLVGINFPLKIYLLIFSVIILNNAIYMKWGPFAVALALNIVGVLTGAALAWRRESIVLNQFIFGYHMDCLFIFSVAIISIYWTYHLIYKSSDPYREKPSFGNL